jgi:pentatricopeptide repeat protein
MRTAGVEPDTTAVNAAISALDKSASIEEAQELFSHMQSTSARLLDCTSYSALIDAYAKRGQIAEANDLVSDMRARGIAPDSPMLVTLVDMYGKSGAHDNACNALDSLLLLAAEHAEAETQDESVQERRSTAALRHDVRRAFNTLIDAYLRFSRPDEAKALLEKLHASASKGVSAPADIFTYTILMRNLTPGPAAPKQARDLYEEMLAANVRGDQALFNCVMDVLIKSRDFASAADAFDLARREAVDPYDDCLSLSPASAKVDLHGFSRAAAAAALEWVLRQDTSSLRRRLAPAADVANRERTVTGSGCDLVLVTGREMTYVGEPNLIRAIIINALRAKRLPFFAADSPNRRGRYVTGGGRIVVLAEDWRRHRDGLRQGAAGDNALDCYDDDELR